MEGNSAKKAPLLDRLVDTPRQVDKTSTTPTPQPQTKPAMPKTFASSTGANQANPTMATPQTAVILNNRRTDKSKFEIELTQIVQQIMNKHFSNASEEIVQEVLREVRARLPGQRKD